MTVLFRDSADDKAYTASGNEQRSRPTHRSSYPINQVGERPCDILSCRGLIFRLPTTQIRFRVPDSSPGQLTKSESCPHISNHRKQDGHDRPFGPRVSKYAIQIAENRPISTDKREGHLHGDVVELAAPIVVGLLDFLQGLVRRGIKPLRRFG